MKRKRPSRRKNKPPPQRARPPGGVTTAARKYLAYIGAVGGKTSTRRLSRNHARQMVEIREAKRRARKEGQIEWASKRIPLPKDAPFSGTARPSVRSRRMMGTFGADSA